MHQGTLTAPRILVRPRQARYQDAYRTWQGIPSVERTPGGRLYANWYSGMDTETGGNFVVVTTSDDNGDTWDGPRYVVEHDDPEVRVYDPCLWLDPLGRLWLTWNQSRDFFDGRVGVWVSTSANPDADEPTWSAPRRIANGLMMNKPTVTATGEWLVPAAIWACHPPTERHGLEAEMFSNVYASTDQGTTFELRGSADVPNRSFDEHMIVERRDGTLWMLVRCFDGIGESFSTDGGRTWSPGRRSHIDGPCSRFHIRRLTSGRLLLINHYGFAERSDRADIEQQGNVKAWKGRSHLTALLSDDDGRTWPHRLLLDERDDVSYPDAAVGDDGTIHVVYDHDRFGDRAIYLARFTEDDILAGRLHDPGSRLRLLVNRALALPTEEAVRPGGPAA
ncbi:sialidase family protein [Streptomyces sp. NPDC044780]|uniref:Sialidase family protein n=1 Tax=Streptomyces luomodiensis TaxID=3026192 RepID=A0ABY9V7D1_9ACTN|nr:sialidase family protein [Streptomyces sp. SCA4-21]WNF00807.1 sialidase family protein [Streptomyces sp. SCA4-21]